MRLWTLKGRGDGHVCLRLPDTGIVCCIADPSAVDHYFPTTLALAQFIVDACNEKEQREVSPAREIGAMRVDRAVAAANEEAQRWAAEERLRQLSAEYQPSERGQQVLNDMAMQPAHKTAHWDVDDTESRAI